MPQGNDLGVFLKNYVKNYNFLKICKFSKTEESEKSYFWKKKKTNFVIIILILTVLIISTSSKFKASSKSQRSRKIKRYLNVNSFIENQDTSPSKSFTETTFENIIKNQYPKQKYSKEKTKKIEKTSNDIKTSPLETLKPDSVNHQINFQNKISKLKFSGQKVKARSKFQKEFPKHFMRLKGVFVLPENSSGKQLEEKYNYLKEINNLMQGNSMKEGKRGKWTKKKLVKNSGAPFRHSTEGKYLTRYGNRIINPYPIKGHKNLKRQELDLVNLTKHPITIYLDFYPMNSFNGTINSSASLRNNTFNSFKTGKGFSPTHRPKGIIMKLNLYSKKSITSNRGYGRQNNIKAEKKSFGWFSNKKKKKEDYPKECSIMGLHPNEKHITAKWKNKNGEWIHAKRVALKYLKKEDKEKRK